MRNLLIAIALILSVLMIPTFTMVACASADVKAPTFLQVADKVAEVIAPSVLAAPAPEVKSTETHQDANLGTVTVTVYKSKVVNL